MKEIDIAAVERAVHGRAPGRVAVLLGALGQLESGLPVANVRTPQEGYTRLAAAVAAVLLDRQAVLSRQERLQLIFHNTITGNLFAASAFHDSAFALEVLRVPDPDADLLERQLALLHLDTPADVDVQALLALPAPLGLMCAINFVATRPVLTAHGEQRRDEVIARAGLLENLELPPVMTCLALAGNAWMNCSYSSAPGKHALKAALNTVMRNLLARLRLRAPALPEVRTSKARPVILVAAEVIHEQHVQYRYFGQYLRQLRTRFELVLVTPKSQLSPAIPELFDRVFTFESNTNVYLPEVLKFIAATAPDIIFWPSVGMARWGPLLANLRLAPIQMTALGHPASTFSDVIDYYLTEEGYVGDPALFSETLLLLPDDSLRFETPAWRGPARPRVRSADADPVIIAIPSNSLKLNPTFLATLARIKAGAARRVEFRLFPNCAPMEAAALQEVVSETLGEATVYPWLAASSYLEALNACDMVLSPFPFGGLHSTVDALRHGLPVVAWEGAEPHSRTDSLILRRVGMPERLICRDTETYVAMAISLIDDPAERLKMGAAALACDVDGKLFAPRGAPLRTEVADAVWAAYTHHEALMASSQKVWRLESLRELG